MNIPLTLNSTYNTRSGNTVTITNIDHSYRHPYFGNIIDAKGKHVTVASFNSAGQYISNQESKHDIVSCHTSPKLP